MHLYKNPIVSQYFLQLYDESFSLPLGHLTIFSYLLFYYIILDVEESFVPKQTSPLP